MKKLILFFIFCNVFFSPVSGKCDKPIQRGLFVAMLNDKSVFSSRAEISKLVKFAKDARINVLYVQVYRANKSWFPSQVADSRPYNNCFSSISDDPLRLLITKAHLAGIKVYAWLNILSLSKNDLAPLLKKYGESILTRNLKEKKSIRDYQIDDQYFLEPGDLRIRDDLVMIVGELLGAYPELDGLQLDYIRYPDSNPAYGFTKNNIARFKKATGIKVIEENSQAWKDWKRTQVNELLKQLVKKARALRPGLEISATGCLPYHRAYYEAFQDWPLWLKQGVVDYVTLMDYSPDTVEFKHWLDIAKSKVGDFSKINISIGAYKLVDAPDTFKKEFGICENTGCGTCTIFYYDSLVDNPLMGDFLSVNPADNS